MKSSSFLSPTGTARLLIGVLLAITAITFNGAVTAQQMEDQELRSVLTRFQELMAKQDLEAAIAELEAVRNSRTDTPPQLTAILGALYAEVGRSSEALELLAPIADGQDANPAVLYNAGKAAMDQGDIPTADRYLTRAVRMAPTSPAARLLGLLRGQLGQSAESYALLKRWVSENPDDAEARIAAAAGAVQLKRPLEAEALLAELPQQDVGVRLLWGRTLMLKGDPYGAIGYLEALVADAPEVMQNDVRGSLVEAYNLIGDSAKAVELLEGLSTDDPKMALNLAIAQFRNGALQTATKTLEPIAEKLKDDVEYRKEFDPSLLGSITMEYGRMLLMDGKAPEALPYLEAAVNASPNNVMAWQNLGQALAASGNHDRAQEALARFQQLTQQGAAMGGAESAEQDLDDPTGKVLREAMAELEVDPENSLRRIRAEAAIAPQDPRPGLYEARALLLLERPQEALTIAKDLATLLADSGPLEADAHYLIGSSQMALEEIDAAEKSLRQALTISPNHSAAMSDLAVVMMSKDKNDEAIRLLEKVLELVPGDPLAQQNLERLRGNG